MSKDVALEAVKNLTRIIKSAPHERGCHINDNWTDWSRPYCSCDGKARAVIAFLATNAECKHCGGAGDIDNGDHSCMVCGGSGKSINTIETLNRN